MMKSYATLALGMTFCLAASAATPAKEVTPSMDVMSEATMQLNQTRVIEPGKIMKKAPAKAASVEDFTGDFAWTYYNMFDAEQTPAGGWQLTGLTFEQADEPNTVMIYGYISLAIKATVDPEAGTLTIPRQFAFTAKDGTDIYLEPHNLVWKQPDKDGNVYLDYIDARESITGTFRNDSIIFDRDLGLGLPNPKEQGSYYGPLLCYSMDMAYDPLYDLNLADWEVLSEPAEFKEGWISPAYSDQDIIYNVNVGVNKKNPNKVILMEPYNNEIWSQVNISTEPGYIIIDFTNPDLVLCQTRLYSGFEDQNNGGFYNYNVEGQLYYLVGYDEEEIDNILWDGGYEASFYQDNVITINNCVFGFTTAKNNGYSWQDKAGNPITMVSEVKLPKAYNDYIAGVEDVEVDNSNAPVKYFNLQGVEIANPTKGQLVIKRQGTSSKKMIAE